VPSVVARTAASAGTVPATITVVLVVVAVAMPVAVAVAVAVVVVVVVPAVAVVVVVSVAGTIAVSSVISGCVVGASLEHPASRTNPVLPVRRTRSIVAAPVVSVVVPPRVAVPITTESRTVAPQMACSTTVEACPFCSIFTTFRTGSFFLFFHCECNAVKGLSVHFVTNTPDRRSGSIEEMNKVHAFRVSWDFVDFENITIVCLFQVV